MRNVQPERQPDFFKNSYESSIMDKDYPYELHPCWASEREGLWERIHVPVAAGCNVQCGFCENSRDGCNALQPAYSNRVISVAEAVEIITRELGSRSNLGIVAVSGPGEPLLNGRALEVFKQIRRTRKDIEFCLSTNGTLLAECSKKLAKLGTRTITVSMSTSLPETAAKIYDWAVLDGKRLEGLKMARAIIERQLQGIDAAVDEGMLIKVNTVLIPGVNDRDVCTLAESLSDHDVSLQNIIPLIPLGRMKTRRAPTHAEVEAARLQASDWLPQFSNCKLCRSDVVGIPGCDTPI